MLFPEAYAQKLPQPCPSVRRGAGSANGYDFFYDCANIAIVATILFVGLKPETRQPTARETNRQQPNEEGLTP